MGRFALLLVAVLVAGCGGADDNSTPAPSTTQPAAPTPSTTATTTTHTTTVEAITTTTGASAGRYVIDEPNVTPVESLPGSDGASGSGCAPGTTELPDGIWFGYVRARSSADIEFDLACFYIGDIAYEVGGGDGEEVNNDYYVRNVNPSLRTIDVDGAVPVYEISSVDISFNALAFADWPADSDGYIACPSDWCGVWLFVNDGVVTEIQEQYIP